MSDSGITVSPSQTRDIVKHLINRKSPDGSVKNAVAPFIWSAPGIGKTSIINEIAVENGARMVALHVQQMDPTDLKGIPIRNEEGEVKWVPSGYMPKRDVAVRDTDGNIRSEYAIKSQWAKEVVVIGWDNTGTEKFYFNDSSFDDMTNGANVEINKNIDGITVSIADIPANIDRIEVGEKAIVFLDELSTADPSVQNAALQLVLDRRIAEYDLPHTVPVIAAGNRESDGAFVQPLSHPLANRFVHLTMTPNLDDFISYGMKKGLRAEVLGYVKAFPNALFNYDPAALGDGRYGFSTPRSLEFLSDQFVNSDTPKQVRNAIFSGIIGEKEAGRFISYVEALFSFPDPMKVLYGEKPKIKGKSNPSIMFGFMISILQVLSHRYKTIKQEHGFTSEQFFEWEKQRDNVYEYIINNFSREIGSFAMCSLLNDIPIDPNHLNSNRNDHSTMAEQFATEFVNVATRLL